MKKTYIEPKSTVVHLNICENLMQASEVKGFGDSVNTAAGAESREVIQLDIKSQDAWEEW